MDWKRFFRLFGVDVFCLDKKYLVFNFVAKNLKVKYRRSVFGVLWTLIVPLCMAAVYYFVFQVLMKVKTENYLIMILAGILPWSFFSQSINDGVVCIVEGAVSLVTKVPIPIHSIPYIAVITHFVTLLLSIPVIIGAAFVSGVGINPSFVMFFVYCGLLFFVSYAMAMILSVGYGYLRDLRHAVGVLMSVWFFATPIVYSVDMVPAEYRWILYLNPVGLIFSGMQSAVVHARFPSAQEFSVSCLWAASLMMIGTLITKKFGRRMVELL